jgi:hypothetical protein
VNLLKVINKREGYVGTIVKDRCNHEGDTGKTRMYSSSSFLVTGSTSMLKRCGTTKDTNAAKAHPSLR